MKHQWLALSNPEGKDYNHITGYLKVSINITGPGDESVALMEDTSKRMSADDDNVLMPTSIRRQYKQLTFRVIRGEKLPQTDRFGTIDAYLRTDFNRSKITTPVVTMKDNIVVWNHELLLPLQIPTASDRLIFKLYDHNTVTDELVGSIKFSIKELMKAENPVYKWVNVYGAPKGVSGKFTDEMNNNPELATTWKGRILIMYYAEDTKNPVMKAQPMTPNQVKAA